MRKGKRLHGPVKDKGNRNLGPKGYLVTPPPPVAQPQEQRDTKNLVLEGYLVTPTPCRHRTTHRTTTLRFDLGSWVFLTRATEGAKSERLRAKS